MKASDIAAIGITSQRETTVVWDRKTGVAIHNARLFEEARQARAAAEEADAAKSAFLSTVSHELRTPLNFVLGFAKIIKKRLEDRIFPLLTTDDRKVRQTIEQVSENLNVVVSEGERLTKLIDDVLDLAKTDAKSGVAKAIAACSVMFALRYGSNQLDKAKEDLAALIVIDGITRLLPGVLGDEASAEQDSHRNGLLDCPHFTRPEYLGAYHVPRVLLGGQSCRDPEVAPPDRARKDNPAPSGAAGAAG